MYYLLILLISFAALLWSANHLVMGATGLASYYKLPPLIIGLTLVALATSAPEILTATKTFFAGVNDVTVGNTFGSNIANIGLILGIISLSRPLKNQSVYLQREVPLLFLAMLFIYSLMLDGYLGVIDCSLALFACLLVTTWLLYNSRPSDIKKHVSHEFRQAAILGRSIKSYALSLLIGLVLLPLSSKYFVYTGAELAHFLGMKKLVAGLTIVALGSSIPELVTSVIAIRKGADDLAIGTILGSNLFNILCIMLVPRLINQAPITHTIIWRDMPVMILTIIIFLWISTKHKKRITRLHGGLLILVYCCYILSLLINAAN